MRARFNHNIYNDNIKRRNQLLAATGAEGELVEYETGSVYPFGIRIVDEEISCERVDFDFVEET